MKKFKILNTVLPEHELETLNTDRLATIIERGFPALWKQVYTRHVENPGSHMGHKVYAQAWPLR